MSTLVAFGNLERPFGRMAMSVLGELAALPRPVIIQAGVNHASFRNMPPYVTVFPTCGFEEFEQLVTDATAVVTHGGAGTIHLAVSNGLLPAVFVRNGDMGEHIDNHQVEWCQSLFAAGLGVEMRDSGSLRHFLVRRQFAQADEVAARKFFDCSGLRADLHGYIRATLAGK